LEDDQGGKVYIPDTFENSESDSETLSDRIRKLDGYGDLGQGCSKQGKDDDFMTLVRFGAWILLLWMKT